MSFRIFQAEARKRPLPIASRQASIFATIRCRSAVGQECLLRRSFSDSNGWNIVPTRATSLPRKSQDFRQASNYFSTSVNATAASCESIADDVMATPIDEDQETCDQITVNKLQALAASKAPQIPQEADALLRQLRDRQIPLTFDCLYWALECWCQTKRKGAEERIEELYKELWQCYRKDFSHHFLDTEQEQGKLEEERRRQLEGARLRVVKAYHHAANAHRAEELLLAFADHNRGWDASASPPPISIDLCKHVLMTWARSQSKRRATRAEKLLSLMMKDPELPDPDISCYTMVLNCWASSDKDNAPQRAELLLRSMEYQENEHLRPNLLSYTCVLNAWARSKQPNAPDEAERLLAEMQNDKKWELDRVVYTAMISVWGRSTRPGTIDKAEEHFRQLCAREAAQRTGRTPGEQTTGEKSNRDEDISATVVEYTALIQAWADHVRKNVNDSRLAVQRVEQLLDELVDRYNTANFAGTVNAGQWRPNRLTFASVLRTIGGALRIPNRHDRAMDALRKMEMLHLEPDNHILWLIDRCSSSPKSNGKKREAKM